MVSIYCTLMYPYAKKIGRLLVLAVCFYFVSCSSFLLPPLQVVSVEFADPIQIVFSEKPAISSIKNAILITEDSKTITGRYAIDGYVVLFYPQNGIKKNKDYVLTINEQAEDIKGNSLLQKSEHFFSTREESVRPLISSIYPCNEEEVDSLEYIQCIFSESIDEASFYDAFSISPSIEFVCDFFDDNTVVNVRPTSPLTKQERYIITVSTDLTDKNNNALIKDFTSTFLYGTDNIPPEYELYQAESNLPSVLLSEPIQKNTRSEKMLSSSFLLQFNEPVDIEAVSRFIRFEPQVSFSVDVSTENKTEARIVLEERPIWEKPYILHIKNGIEDLSKNQIKESSTYELVFNNEKERAVEFLAAFLHIGTGNQREDYFEVSSHTDYSTLVLDVTRFAPATGSNEVLVPMYFVFSASAASDGITENSAKESINIFTTNNCVSIILKSMERLEKSEYATHNINTLLTGIGGDIDANARISVLHAFAGITNSKQDGLIELYIDKNICDTLGNTLVDSFTSTVNKK